MPSVETRFGRIDGVEAARVVAFKGVPFAASTEGAARFAPPEPPRPWSGVYKADGYGPVAPQPEMPGMPILDGLARQSEDCLTLNVWTPACDGARRPVLVWIHGGAFLIGAGSQSLYDGAKLARRGDVVVVTINYRLGPFGFLRLEELTGGRIPASGNEGLLDQIAALCWVRDHIARFGGDPGNVTIFGESAGAMAVAALLVMPAARGLFHRAIAQSGAGHGAREAGDGTRVAAELARLLEIDGSNADAWRSLAPARFHALALKLGSRVRKGDGGIAPDIMTYQPVVDGNHLPQRPIEAMQAGVGARVPLLIGTTSEEMKFFPPEREDWGDSDLARRLHELMPVSHGEDLIARYRALDTGASARDLYYAIETDRIFRLPALRLAEAAHAHATPAYVYEFTWPSPAMGGAFGSCHAIDLGFTFGNGIEGLLAVFFGMGPSAQALADTMMDAWCAFARTGKPETPALGPWPVYEAETRATMMLGATSALARAPGEARRAIWNAISENDLG